MSDKTTSEVAALFRCSTRKITEEATRHGIGMNLRGPAGYRFTDADVELLRKALAPLPPVEKKRTA